MEIRMTKVNDQFSGKNFTIWNADCVQVARGLPDASVGMTVYSPPFESLYTYSNSERDLGNCKSTNEFARHFRFLAHELFRVTMPGRCMSGATSSMPRPSTAS